MRVLIVGGGGREHALAWKAVQGAGVECVYVAPGNAGTAEEPHIHNVPIQAEDIESLLHFALEKTIALTIVGPEVPLVAGIVDTFQAAGLTIFGPTAAAAQLEGSKTFSKEFLIRHTIPTATYQSFTQAQAAIEYAQHMDTPIVVKADGLAAGKGVVIANTHTQAAAAINNMLAGNAFGEAGHRVVIEAFLDGEEASFICMVDGKNILPMATSQDHKARDEGDKGPNTGGMGAYSPAPIIDASLHQQIMQKIIHPTVDGMAADGTPFTGFLYAGVMISKEGTARVLEFNVRFGDPETQAIMLRLKGDLVAMCLAACNQKLDQVDADWDNRSALGVVMAADGYPEEYAKGHHISGLSGIDNHDVKVFHAGTAINPMGDIITAGGRVLCVAALGNSVQEAQQTAHQNVEKIEWEGAYYRRDIGYRAIARE